MMEEERRRESLERASERATVAQKREREYRARAKIERQRGGRRESKMERDCLHVLSRQLI